VPIKVNASIRHLNQGEFAEVAYEVMDHVFAIHNEMGRFLDEAIYRRAVAGRVEGDSQTEVLIRVSFEDFFKDYYMDLLVAGGAVFELKAVQQLVPAHRSQLLNYLLLCELSHGKLVNLRGDKVEHEFVNTHLKHSDRTNFQVTDREWNEPDATGVSLREWLLAFLRDVGTGLDIYLYESAVSHFFGGEDAVLHEVDILLEGQHLGRQKVPLAAPNWAFKVTTIDNAQLSRFEDHARRFLQHTKLDGLQWINITRSLVSFRTVTKA
jgi:GxxExxY protein